jgi:hypothetical protein
VGKQLLQEKEELYKFICTLVEKEVIAEISYQIILTENHIVMCENYNVE